MGDVFYFNEDFEKFENNPKIQKPIERIFRSNNPFLSFEWVENKEEQAQGIDLKIDDGSCVLNVDIKAVTHAENHHYLEDISIEIVSDHEKYLQSKGKEGKSWLFKEDCKTDQLLYYWLNEHFAVKNTLILIDFEGLRKWASSYFNLYELYPFLNQQVIKDKIASQRYKSRFLENFKDFEIFSAKNVLYHTINVKMELSHLNKLFKQFNLGTISKISLIERPNLKLQKELKLADFF